MIQSPLLPHPAGYVDGAWATSGSASPLCVRNPATGEILAEVPGMTAAEVTAAIESAARTKKVVLSENVRREWLTGIAEGLLARKQELARIITLEQGKPLKESIAEVEYSAGFFQFFAGQLELLRPRLVPGSIRNAEWTVHHRPAGVAALITPWNFPLAMMAKKLSAALGAGCSIVAKPASFTPLSSMAMWKIAESAGVPAGRIQLVVGSAREIGKVLCQAPSVRIISFTGSTEVGQALGRESGSHIKRLSLELGGNAPFLVFEDADVDAAVAALLVNKFRCAGQTCVCTNRVYVHEKIHARFIDLVADRVKALKVGNGMDESTDIGPLINRDGFEKVVRHVNDAVAQGAKRVVGGQAQPASHDWGWFFPPTVLSGVRQEMLVFQEEVFGPVIPIASFRSEEDVLAQANGTPYGLAAYVFTGDPECAKRCAAALQFGHVAINSGTGPTPEAPFGGMKSSGYGREGGPEGLTEYCEVQSVANGRV